jgi:hypothetical protein
MTMTKRAVALLLAIAVTLAGCATTRRLDRQETGYGRDMNAPVPRSGSQVTTPATNQKLLADYVQKLPVGTRVRVHLMNGRRERGTLMDATAERIVVQRRTRIPEPATEIPLDRVTAVDVETGNGGVGKAIAIGIAAGAGATFGVLLLLAAIYSD